MKNGFTLIELLVVVLIIGILAAVALPQYQKAVQKARLSEALVHIDTLQKMIHLYVLEHGYPAQLIYFTGEDKVELDIELACEDEEDSFCIIKDFEYSAGCDSAGNCFIDAWGKDNAYLLRVLFARRGVNGTEVTYYCGYSYHAPESVQEVGKNVCNMLGDKWELITFA